MNRLIVSAVSVGLLLLAGCPGGGDETPPPPTHVLSGTITRAWGGALPGVAVTLGGAASGTAMTDASGKYTFPSVSDGTYTLSPALAGYVFTPSAPSVTVSGADRTQDFSADGAYTISGTVSGSVQGGVSIALSGGGVVKPPAVSAAVTGLYSFAGIPNGTYTLTPALAGHLFTPAAPAVVVAGANATQDFTGAAQLSISGTVHDGVGAPLSGMTVRLTGASTAIATTDGAGAFAFTGLAQGQSYTVTPATFGYAFDPARGAQGPVARTYTLTANVTSADFGGTGVGEAHTYTGTLSYSGSKTGPVYVTITGPYGGVNPAGGTGLTSQQVPWGGRAFTVRNVQVSGAITARAWIDTLGVGKFNAGADPSVSVNVDTNVAGFDLGALTLLDPSPTPTVTSPLAVSGILPGDQTVVVVFDEPRNADFAPVADSYRVYWNTSATVDAAHTLGAIVVPTGPGFAIVHGLTNGTGYWFRVEAYLGGAPLGGQSAVTTAPTPPAVPSETATVSGTVAHPAVASPSALYVIAQGNKGAAGAVWFQRIPNPTGTQTAYALPVPPGTYQLFAFMDVGDDGAVTIGEPGAFPSETALTVAIVAGPNAGPTIAFPTGNATASLRTSRWANPSSAWTALVLGVGSNAKVPLSAIVTGPGLRGPVDLGINMEGGGSGIAFGASWNTDPIVPFVGDAYTMQVTYADGTAESFPRPVTGVFGGTPGVVAPADGATDVATVPTFEWSAPSGPPGPYTYSLHIWPQSGGDTLWETFMPGSQTAVAYNADGMAAQPQLSAFTSYGWAIRALDANWNEANYQAGFTTGAAVLPSYDPLTGTTLDGQLWQTPQFTRSISGGRAVLAVQADDMQARTVQGTTYTNAINVLPSGNRVTTLRASVILPSATTAIGGTAVAHGGVRLVYQPAVNRGGPFPTANMNILTATLELFEDGGGLHVRRRVYHCDDAACVTLGEMGITVVDPAGFTVAGVNALAPAAYDTAYTLAVSLDEGSGTFTWSVQGGAFTVPVIGTANVSAWAASVGMTLGTANNGFFSASLFSRASDDTGGSSAQLAPEFDDVAVGLDGAVATLWDDFSSGSFSPAKWGAVDSDVWLSGGSLHLASELTTTASAAGVESTPILPMYPTSFRAWQANVAIVADTGGTGSPNSVGMGGAFYNDGTAGGGAAGDVRARITLQIGSASYVIFKCTQAACNNSTLVTSGPLVPSPAHPLDVGTVHALMVQWDAASHLFSFVLDDAVVLVDPTVVNPSVPAPVASPTPRYPFHFFITNVSVPAGATGRIEATVSDVRGSPP